MNQSELQGAGMQVTDSMRTARNGKIARLPLALREEVNRRLEEHQSGPKILAWLNAEPVVKDMVDREFGGKPISRQNLSQWRRDGFQEWRYLKWAAIRTQQSAGNKVEDIESSNRREMAFLRQVCAEELTAMVQWVRDGGLTLEKRFKYMCMGVSRINDMRREDNREARNALAVEKAYWEVEKAMQVKIAPGPGFVGANLQVTANQGPVKSVKVNQSKKFHER